MSTHIPTGPSLHQRATKYLKANVTGGTARGFGCHECLHKPEPGAKFEETLCARCTIGDSRSQGHGRGCSFEAIAPMLRTEEADPAESALRALTETEKDEDAGARDDDPFFDSCAPSEDAAEEEPWRPEVAHLLRAIVLSNPDESRLAALRLSGASLDRCAFFIRREYRSGRPAPWIVRGVPQDFRPAKPDQRAEAALRVHRAFAQIPGLEHLAREGEPDPATLYDAMPEASEERREAVRGFLRRWARTGRSAIQFLQGRIDGDSYRNFARNADRTVTIQAVHEGIKNALREDLIPEIAQLLPLNNYGFIRETQQKQRGGA